MTVPSLPLDLWFRISTFLLPAELSSLSQVNHELNKIATDEAHFRRILAIPESPCANPSLAYRRQRALLHPPTVSTVQISRRCDILCILEDTLILVDTLTAAIISFPTGHTASLDDLIGNQICIRDGVCKPRRVRKYFAILPGGHIAFLKGSDPTLLTVLDVTTWEMEKHIIPGERCRKATVFDSSNVFVAGNDGEFILFPVGKTIFALVDWRNGSIVRKFTNPPEPSSWKWLVGTCPATNDRSIVGVARQVNEGSNCEIRVEGFDGKVMSFPHEEDMVFSAVLRSADTMTHMLVCYRRRMYITPPIFIAHKQLSDIEQMWSGLFLPWMAGRLVLNGNVIEVRPLQRLRTKISKKHSISHHQFVVLRDDGTMEEIWSPRLESGSQIVWSKRTSEKGLAIVGAKSQDLVQVRRLRIGCEEISSPTSQEDGPNGKAIHTFSVEGLTNLCVLADHVVLAMRADGKMETFHFDQFCREGGVCDCPWDRALENFRLPRPPSLLKTDSRADKRRRT